jgi:hypothetical protein
MQRLRPFFHHHNPTTRLSSSTKTTTTTSSTYHRILKTTSTNTTPLLTTRSLSLQTTEGRISSSIIRRNRSLQTKVANPILKPSRFLLPSFSTAALELLLLLSVDNDDGT